MTAMLCPTTTRDRTYSDTTRELSWTATARLVERAQDGDRAAFGELVEQFQPTVYAVCLNRLGNASEAAEMTQDVFLHVMKRLDQLREPERFAGWLRQVAARMAINRATRRVPPVDASRARSSKAQAASMQRDDPLDGLIRRERASRLWAGLERLKTMDRETLISFYIQGQSLLEISETLETPVGTIKRRLHTARKRLKAELPGRLPRSRGMGRRSQGSLRGRRRHDRFGRVLVSAAARIITKGRHHDG